jgi:hypothetical protein
MTHMKTLPRLYSCVMMAAALSLAACGKKDSAALKPATLGATQGSLSTLSSTAIPAANNNKVAYYTFDATPTGTPAVKQSMLTFAKDANIVVVFEGRPWELTDSAHYGSTGSIMLSGYYKSYAAIIADIHTLESRGVKVLMNIDDATSWNTTTPFTTYNGTAQTYTQYASFVNTAITTLGMDGISLDVEHMGSTAANTNFTNLLKEFGKYWGPKSSAPTTTIYTAAIYTGGKAGYAIGQSTTIAAYFNFVMDMGYSQNNTTRFNTWANYIGAAKTMILVSKDYNSQSSAVTAAQWHPTTGTKAGIGVYAANVDSAYTGAVLRALK